MLVSCFVGILGTFNFLVKGGRKILDASRRGGEKFWTCHLGGRKILDFEFFGILRENKGTRIKLFA